jgi:hypothetical protein
MAKVTAITAVLAVADALAVAVIFVGGLPSLPRQIDSGCVTSPDTNRACDRVNPRL